MTMIKGIDNPIHKEKTAIVVVGYNRLKSLKRLLKSIDDASYAVNDIPLVISIDASGDESVYELARKFQWKHGEKYVNIQQERLGLKDHIYQCGDLTRYFKAIILLEDDLVVSPFFYSYVEQAIEHYQEDESIAQISLYKNERNGYVGLPFMNLRNGSDVFLMQDVSTWGECWTEKMWNEFTHWRDSHSEEYILSVDMPSRIKKWTRAWSKYYNAYVVDTHKYVIYPNVSLTSNFSDAGEHGGDNNSIVQVNLQQGDFLYRMYNSEKLVRYDIYFNNEMLSEWLHINGSEICLDTYGFHENRNKRYILSTRLFPYKILKSYALYMRPIELNVRYGIEGCGLFLYDTNIPNLTMQAKCSKLLAPYFLQGFNTRLLASHVISMVLKAIKKRMHL